MKGRWAVEHGSRTLGFICDEGPWAPQGRYSTWSPYAEVPGNSGGFFQDPAEAVDVVVCLWPQSPASIVQKTGAPAPQIVVAAELLDAEWSEEGRCVYRSEIRGEDARLAGEAAAAIRQDLGLDADAVRDTARIAARPAETAPGQG
ncbi:hypothetical protein [Streptomyces zaomyceticus]|uniref:hypothetical protein n=1 Tax=Streptomyces zaomyceticus TaxID=68286 RepID=UPI0037976144